MDKQQLDKNINLLAWLIGVAILMVLSIFAVIDKYWSGMLEGKPLYSLLIMAIPVVILQFINYQLVGKYRLSFGISDSYMYNKLLFHPSLWSGAALAFLINYVLGS